MVIINSQLNPDDNLLTITFGDNTQKKIAINDDNKENLGIIYKSNITYRGHQHKYRNLIQYSASSFGGWLPSACLDIDKPSVNLSTRYLINAFIEHMSLLFRDDCNNRLFERDDQTIPIPISENDMSKFYDKLTEDLLKSNNNEIENNNNVQMLMKMVLQFMLDIKTEGEKNASDKNIKKLKRGSNKVGRFNYQDAFDHLKDNNNLINKEDIAKNLKDSTANIQNFIYENREIIKNILYNSDNRDDSAFHQVLEILESDHDTPLYIQYNIRFDQMFETTGQIINAALYTLIPKTSFILALQACFYNAAFLYQLNLLTKFSDSIFLPILYRLTYTCFRSDVSNDIIPQVKEYMELYYPEISKQISKLTNDVDKNIDALTKISSKVNIKDEKCLDGLFWLLNEVRGYTFEYYLILLAHIFSNTNKVKNLNRHNKISNIAQFLRPLHCIVSLYWSHVIELGLDVALSSKTLETFNTLYSNEINQAISHFSAHLLTTKN